MTESLGRMPKYRQIRLLTTQMLFQSANLLVNIFFKKRTTNLLPNSMATNRVVELQNLREPGSTETANLADTIVMQTHAWQYEL